MEIAILLIRYNSYCRQAKQTLCFQSLVIPCQEGTANADKTTGDSLSPVAIGFRVC